MPFLILAAVLSLVVGFAVRDTTKAFGIAAALGAIGVFQMVWAVTDGKGDDPGWLVPVGAAALAVDLALVAIARRVHPSNAYPS